MDSFDVNILTLPEDVIIIIFQLLPQFEVLQNVRLTCKTWNHISRHGILWRRIRDLDFIRCTFSIENFMRFLRDISHSVEYLEIDIAHISCMQKKNVCFLRTRSLNVYRSQGYDNTKSQVKSLKVTTRLLPVLPKLEVLHVNSGCFDFDVTCCPKDLKKLVVDSWCEGLFSYSKHQRNVGEHLKNLTHLGLHSCYLTNQTVLELLTGLTCLESIDLSETNWTSIDLRDDDTIPDAPCSKKIQKVVLNNTNHKFFPHVFMYILVSAHDSIRYIDISNRSQEIIAHCLYRIAEKCKQLDTLVLGNNDNYEQHDEEFSPFVSDKSGEINRGIKDVASNNQHLSTIKLNFTEAIIDNETVLHVFQNCSKLQWIKILESESLPDTLGAIANGERLRVTKISKLK